QTDQRHAEQYCRQPDQGPDFHDCLSRAHPRLAEAARRRLRPKASAARPASTPTAAGSGMRSGVTSARVEPKRSSSSTPASWTVTKPMASAEEKVRVPLSSV